MRLGSIFKPVSRSLELLHAILLSCFVVDWSCRWILQVLAFSSCFHFSISTACLPPRKQWLVDSVWHLFVITVNCCLCFTSFSFVTLRFDEETTVLESYEVKKLRIKEPSIHLLYVCVYACLPACGFRSGWKEVRGSFFRSQTFLFLTRDVGLRSLLRSRKSAKKKTHNSSNHEFWAIPKMISGRIDYAVYCIFAELGLIKNLPT